MQNGGRQIPGQQRKKSFMPIIIGLSIFLIFVAIISNNISSGPSPSRIDLAQFNNMMGVSEEDGDRVFNVWPTYRIRAVVQQGSGGNNFLFLAIRAENDLTDEQINSRISNFLGNPSNYATHSMFFRNTDIIIETINAQNNFASAHLGAIDNVRFQSVEPGRNWGGYIMSFLPLLIMLVFVILLLRGVSGRGGGVMGMSKHRATVVWDSPVRFKDVAGIEEEKAEVEEIVSFLKQPKKFLDMGARIPKGFLLIGPPGTGKTMMAKAIAGEAGVPFFSVSGSDFSEMLVGVGPSRMRGLFEEAKAAAAQRGACVIFIDEIDSIARMRGASVSGASDENEQTLNQLLVQMDGFSKSEGVIVMAATNRPDILDQALLRPGRFDRQIMVQMPDARGREKILTVHSAKKPMATDVDLKRVAQIISGFSGADIENLLNESAIIAARRGNRKISMSDITEGINKVLLGPQKRSRIITEEDKKITAYHEAGHAIVSHTLQPKMTVQEVSIIPRGMAAGYMLTNDKDDATAHKSKSFLKSQLAVYMGGRAAEAHFIGDICTGASSDIKAATSLAYKMVTSFGMSEKLGPLYFGQSDEAMLRGNDRAISNDIQAVIDGEIRDLVVEGTNRAMELMKKHEKKIEVMVAILLDRETIYAEDVDMIMNGASQEEVVSKMEERFEKSREEERKAKIDNELEELDRHVRISREIAMAHISANLWTLEKMDALEANIELAKKLINDGHSPAYFPTVDNLEIYAKLVQVAPAGDSEANVTQEETSPEQTVSSEEKNEIN